MLRALKSFSQIVFPICTISSSTAGAQPLLHLHGVVRDLLDLLQRDASSVHLSCLSSALPVIEQCAPVASAEGRKVAALGALHASQHHLHASWRDTQRAATLCLHLHALLPLEARVVREESEDLRRWVAHIAEARRLAEGIVPRCAAGTALPNCTVALDVQARFGIVLGCPVLFALACRVWGGSHKCACSCAAPRMGIHWSAPLLLLLLLLLSESCCRTHVCVLPLAAQRDPYRHRHRHPPRRAEP